MTSPTYTYQWKRSGAAIVGATGGTYSCQPVDVGETISCTVTASNSAGTTTVTTASTGVVTAAATQTRFVGFTMDLTNRNGMQGKQMSASDAGSYPSRTDFPGGGSPATQQSLPCYIESFTDYLSVFPWPALIGCFMNTNTPDGSNVALLYYGSGAGSTASQGGYPTYEGQLTDPAGLIGSPFKGAPYKNPGGGAATPTVPNISWDLGGTSLAAIAGGNYDTSTIIPAARACKAWPASNPGNPAYGSQPGGQVLIRLCHEMNGSWSGYSPGSSSQPSGTTCADFVAAWRHIVQVFANEGATNARWHWCPNTFGAGAGTPNQSGYARTSGTTALLYPGDAYVDYVGLDGYNGAQGDTSWQTFASLFQASYDAIYNGDSHTIIPGATKAGPITTTKPMILGEIGCLEADQLKNVPTGQSKAQWYTDMHSYIPTSMPNVVGVVYWHENAGNTLEMYLTSSTSAVAAWKTIAEDWDGRPAVVAGVTAALA